MPICEFCLQHKHECIYSRIVRTPLTRRNLDAAESRIRRLEALLSKQQAETSADDSANLLRALPPRGPTAVPPSGARGDGDDDAAAPPPLSFTLPRPEPGPSHLPADPSGDVAFADHGASGLRPPTFPPPELPSLFAQPSVLPPPPPRPIGSSVAPHSAASNFPRTSSAISGSTFGHPASASSSSAQPLEPPPPVTHSSVTSTGHSEAVHETDEDGMGALTVDAGSTSSSYLGAAVVLPSPPSELRT